MMLFGIGVLLIAILGSKGRQNNEGQRRRGAGNGNYVVRNVVGRPYLTILMECLDISGESPSLMERELSSRA